MWSLRDVIRSPDGWSAVADGEPVGGVWTKPLLDTPGGDAFALLRLAPGAEVRLAVSGDDRFLVLAGRVEIASGRHHRGDYVAVASGSCSACDELVFPDGRRETAERAAGDFVDYPTPVEHQTFSELGATILFVHEPLR